MRLAYGAKIFSLSLLLMACDREHRLPQERATLNAPTEPSKVGLVLEKASESELAQLAEEDSNFLIRPINRVHGLYEVHGKSEAELRRLLRPETIVTENKYIYLEKPENLKEVEPTLNPPNNDFLKSCNSFGGFTEQFEIEVNAPMERFEISHLFELGDSVNLKIEKSEFEFLWQMEPPAESGIPSLETKGSEINFKPDFGGVYFVNVVAKDPTGKCWMKRKSIFVTANPELNPNSRLTSEELQSFNLDMFWHLENLGAMEVWQQLTGSGQVIAVIDTGVNYNHSSLNENIYINEDEVPNNGLDDDQNGFIDDAFGYDFSSADPYPFDDDGHGSHVAGLAAARSFGLAKKAKIMPLKVLTGQGLDIASFTGAIYYAVDNGADVINASFGWSEDYPSFFRALKYAQAKGVVVVASAGNGDTTGVPQNTDINPNFPSSYDLDNIVSVASVIPSLELASYSNFGPLSVDLASFGGDFGGKMISAHRDNVSKSLFRTSMGTSQAAPLVSAAVALLNEKYPQMNTDQILVELSNCIEASPKLQNRLRWGGALNLKACL